MVARLSQESTKSGVRHSSPRGACRCSAMLASLFLMTLGAWAGSARAESAGPVPVTSGLVLDLDADKGVTADGSGKVSNWRNQVNNAPAQDFHERDADRAWIQNAALSNQIHWGNYHHPRSANGGWTNPVASGKPRLLQNVDAINNHNALKFELDELHNDNDAAFDGLHTGSGYTWFVLVKPYPQSTNGAAPNAFFGCLRNTADPQREGGNYSGFFASFEEKGKVYVSSRNGEDGGLWPGGGKTVRVETSYSSNQWTILAARQGAGSPNQMVNLEVFLNGVNSPVASGNYKISPSGSTYEPSRLVIGQERNARNHMGQEGFKGELARFLIFDRPLNANEMSSIYDYLHQTYLSDGGGNQNNRPVVNAGQDQTVVLPAGASLSGTGSDDGQPNGVLTIAWSKVSGPGTVSFTDASKLTTSVTFGLPGTYVLRLTGDDGELSASDEVTIHVSDPASLREPENPAGATNGLDWQRFHGSWNALPDFATLTPAASGTTSTFSLGLGEPEDKFAYHFTGYIDVPADGEYLFYTTSDDGSKLYIGNTEVVNNDGLHPMVEKNGSIGLKAGKHAITVDCFEKTGGEGLIVHWSGPGLAKSEVPASVLYRVGGAPTNQAPVVNAGADQSITLPVNTVNLSGTSSDDGLPGGALSTTWSKVSGPGAVAFANAGSQSTTASFVQAGTYVLRLTADDGEISTTDELTVEVLPEAPAGQAPFGGTPWPIPGTIQAEDYDTGGEGVAYHDVTTGNSGRAHRTDDVDVERSSEGVANIGWTAAGEWVEYTVDVTAAGAYDISARVASSRTNGGTFHIEFGGVDSTGSITVPHTGGWQNWTTVSVKNVHLNAGTQVMRVSMDSSGFNINSLEFAAAGGHANMLPVAEAALASTDPTVGMIIQLSGTGSSDPDGSIMEYEWTQVGGPDVILDLTNPEEPFFVAAEAGTYIFDLRVQDDQDAWSTDASSPKNTVVFEVAAAQTAPTLGLNTIVLKGTVSDLDGSVVSVTVNGSAATLTHSAWQKEVAVSDGDNTFTIVATDDDGLSTTSNVTITK